MNKEAYIEILKNIYTKKQADTFVANIDTLIASLYSKGRTLNKIQATFSLELSEEIIEVMRKEKISFNDNDACKKFFESLRKIVLDIPTIDLTISFDPTLSQVQKICHWIINNKKEKHLLHIIVDPGIIGGVQIGLDGRYKDKSLKAKLGDMTISL